MATFHSNKYPSITRPVLTDGQFHLSPPIFTVTVDSHSHDRIPPHILSQLLEPPAPVLTKQGAPAKRQPPSLESPRHFWVSQLIHYGIPYSLGIDLDGAKGLLQSALRTSSAAGLKPPKHIVETEKRLYKAWEKTIGTNDESVTIVLPETKITGAAKKKDEMADDKAGVDKDKPKGKGKVKSEPSPAAVIPMTESSATATKAAKKDNETPAKLEKRPAENPVAEKLKTEPKEPKQPKAPKPKEPKQAKPSAEPKAPDVIPVEAPETNTPAKGKKVQPRKIDVMPVAPSPIVPSPSPPPPRKTSQTDKKSSNNRKPKLAAIVHNAGKNLSSSIDGVYRIDFPHIQSNWGGEYGNENDDLIWIVQTSQNTNHVWIKFEAIVLEGIMRSTKRKSGNKIEFRWRGSENEGEMTFGSGNTCEITFKAKGKIDGKMSGPVVGKDGKFSGVKIDDLDENDQEQNLRLWKYQHAKYNSRNHETESSARWGGWSGDGDYYDWESSDTEGN